MVGTIAFGIEEFREYAAKAQLGLQFVVKEAFMFDLMELMAEKEFILKGGTAINKGYLAGHQRFSEDLDYDTDLDRANVRKIIHGLGWKVKKYFFTKHVMGFLLSYSVHDIKDVVKVEIAFGKKHGPERRNIISDFLPISKRVNMYGFSSLNLQKEHAMEDRHEWKDLYDLFWMKNLYTAEFRIQNKPAFKIALAKLRVPKTANSFIPRSKRLNWENAKAEMEEFCKQEE